MTNKDLAREAAEKLAKSHTWIKPGEAVAPHMHEVAVDDFAEAILRAIEASQVDVKGLVKAAEAVVNLPDEKRLHVLRSLDEAEVVANLDDALSAFSAHPSPSLPIPERELAREQPCGCVVCICEDEEQCYGCGAKNCGAMDCVFRHPENKVYAHPSPEAQCEVGMAKMGFHRVLPADVVEVLRQCEWAGRTHGGKTNFCPWCLRDKTSVHAKTCKLAALLKKYTSTPSLPAEAITLAYAIIEDAEADRFIYRTHETMMAGTKSYPLAKAVLKKYIPEEQGNGN